MSTLPNVPIEPARQGPRFSYVWLIPVLALVIALGVAWQTYAERGPLIEVTFRNADGVNPGETELRYRDIPVGFVEKVGFTEDLESVVVSIRLSKDVAGFVDADARFWVVRPQVTAQGVSGLDTVLSGVYIEGAWDGVPSTYETRFVGSEKVPLLSLGERGTTFTLRSEEGLPNENTPILYRGVQVGKIGATEVSADGLTVTAEAVILEPYNDLVTVNSRFWDISGFSFSLDAGGARLDFNSLASLISGGVTFATLGSGGAPLAQGAVYDLHPDEETAREDFFLEGDGGSVDLMMIFDENLAGLSAGAPVNLGGLRMGEVVTISGVVDEERFGDTEVRLIATLRLNPGRIGLADSGEDAFIDFLSRQVRQGLRGQLTNASLLTGGLKIDLVMQPDAPDAELILDGDPYPQIPTTPSKVTNVAASAQGLLQRADALPVEELLENAIGFLGDARALVNSDGVQDAPEELRATLAAIRSVAESEEVAALPAQIGAVAGGLEEASVTLNALLGDVQDQAVIASVSELIASLDATAQALPGLADQASAVLTNVESVPLGDLSGQLSALLGNADALVSDEDLTAMPADLRATVQSLRGLLSSDEIAALPGQIGSLAAGLQEASDTLNGILTDVEEQQLVAQVADVIASVDKAAATLPGLSEQAQNILSDVEELSLQTLADRASALLTTADELIGQDSTKQLPAELNATLAELRTMLAQISEGGLVDNANATLASARTAAEALATASGTLPALAERISRVAAQAGVTIGDYNRGSEFGRELSTAIRQIEAAASSIDRLARQIQRNPNSLLTGR
ncbi:MlaD family protein [Tropicibacter naphthalenivorans]|uniref:Paraquat-inducible protein B n=1 Tax=Tropicibacter naphthalenivorans TaxID=441103 RepID=A0A0P1GHB7_9RHOB|nr:MlaD family protein [Tropicibacter naphthalenivorans]CUH81087.1 Paraquat-inducible protein B [Tropicibacter naphthalenivorans]SMC97056.1 paraquat-inducible protein B [Tropicibacter naphthalenivorans]